MIKNAGDFILNGIYKSTTSTVRSAFKDNLELIAEKVTKNNETLPLYYLIMLLKENMPSPEMKILTTESAQFFNLLGALIIQYQTLTDAKSKGDGDVAMMDAD